MYQIYGKSPLLTCLNSLLLPFSIYLYRNTAHNNTFTPSKLRSVSTCWLYIPRMRSTRTFAHADAASRQTITYLPLGAAVFQCALKPKPKSPTDSSALSSMSRNISARVRTFERLLDMNRM